MKDEDNDEESIESKQKKFTKDPNLCKNVYKYGYLIFKNAKPCVACFVDNPSKTEVLLRTNNILEHHGASRKY